MRDAGGRIPCTIVTGFLGAGKTTLVRHLLETTRGTRLAVIVNEFGDVGIDGEILKGCGISSCTEERIVELPNGCLCCTVADDFVPALEGLLALAEPPDHILIETSGLALPKPLVKAFNWPAIRSRVTVDAVVTVVDADALARGRFVSDPDAAVRQRAGDAAVEHDDPVEEVYEDQLLCADLVVLNKTDLLGPGALERISAEIAAIVPAAVKLVPASGGRVDGAVLLGLGAAAEADVEARPSHHDGEEDHDHDDFESFALPIGPVADAETLRDRVARAVAAHDILRIKGFAEVPGRPMRLVVHGVGTRVQHHFDRPWAPGEAPSGRLVVIGAKGLDRAAIAAALDF